MSTVRFADNDFIAGLPGDPLEAILVTCEYFFERCGPDASVGDTLKIELAEDAYYFVAHMAEHVWRMDFGRPGLNPEDPEANYENIQGMFKSWQRTAVEHKKEFRRKEIERAGRLRYAGVGGSYVIGSMDEHTLARIQQLINDIRSLITKSAIDDEHKRRLLQKLEGLQGEMHKDISDLDRFWAFMGEAGRVLGQLGKDVKPLIDRIRELMNAVASVGGFAPALPSGDGNKKQLPPG